MPETFQEMKRERYCDRSRSNNWNEDKGDASEEDTNPSEEASCSSYKLKADHEGPLQDLKLENLNEVHREKFREILQRYPRLYNGSLGEVVATEQVIDLKNGANPHRKLPYRTGSGFR